MEPKAFICETTKMDFELAIFSLLIILAFVSNRKMYPKSIHVHVVHVHVYMYLYMYT